MRRLGWAIGVLLPLAAGAQDAWAPLTGEEVREALTDRKLQYASAWQEFRASGRTLYNAGQDSWGYWRLENDQYCSMWPPSDLWACYRVEGNEGGVRFIGQSGDITEGVYTDD